MRIAVIGAGNVGGTLGRAWAKAGHEVMFGVLDPSSPKVAALLATTGGRATAGRVAEAATYGAVVALCTPWDATESAVRGSRDLAGKILLDCTNPLEKDLSGLAVGRTTSGAELVARSAPGARVVKAFNTTGFENMADPDFGGRAATMLIAGDDEAANAVASEAGKRDGYDIDKWGVLDYGSAMPRTARVAPGGMVFHVLNRGVARMQLFEKAADYQAFEQVLQDTLDQSPMRICAYAVMPNHWHLLLWPEGDGELAAFMQRLTITHVRRWQEHRGYAGLGHVYQGRYKSFPVESDEHFWVVARSVERNALRANLVLRAEEWRWSSLWQRCHPTGEERSLLAAWPIDMPANWLERVNQTDNAQELEALRRSVQRGRPFGQPEWQKEIAQRLGLESAYRPTGRPRKVGRNQNASPG